MASPATDPVAEPLLEVRDLAAGFDLPKAAPWSKREHFLALKDVSFSLRPGQSLGIVGESGSGKTTLGHALLRLLKPCSGQILFKGRDIASLTQRQLRPLRQRMQMIFQDPQSSLNPRRRVASIITQPLLAFDRMPPERTHAAVAGELLERVGLGAGLARRFPHELSGGQRQRVGIARAVALEPDLLVADEIVSGLDVSSQAQIVALLGKLQAETGLTLIFISHDLSVVRKLCDTIMVMQGGRVVEHNTGEALFHFARHPYTRELIQAIPLPDIDERWLDQSTDLSTD